MNELSTLIFVIDAQDDYSRALNQLNQIIIRAYNLNPNVNIEIFVHKVDGLSDEYKYDTLKDIQGRVIDELLKQNSSTPTSPTSPNSLTSSTSSLLSSKSNHNHNININQLNLPYYLTSIYDHSILKSFSIVLQKLLNKLTIINNLLNIFCSNSEIQKCYLFENKSRLYFSTNVNGSNSVISNVDDIDNVDQTFEVCVDALDTFDKFSKLYK